RLILMHPVLSQARPAATTRNHFVLGCISRANVFTVRTFPMNATLALRSLLLGSFLATSLFAQSPAPKIDFPAPSPNATIEQRVGATDIKIEYYRPGVKGRKIFAPASALPLQPYGEIWRTGANNPTKVTFSTPVKFGGK